jgi:transcriptional regulator with XRE-family HTH domain
MNLTKFSFVLEKALIEWRTRQTRQRKSVSLKEFASYLGYSRPIVSQWLNKNKLPSRGTVEVIFPKLVELLGDEAYDILELSHPDPHLTRLINIWHKLPEELRKELADHGEKYLSQNDLTK